MKDSRSKYIIRSGHLFIATNILLAALNVVIGIISGSLAIISDSVHSLIDAISGLLIIVSEKLCEHKKLTDYRARIERTTTIIIALIIISAGIEIILEAIEKIASGDHDLDYNIPTIIILVVSIALKYSLAIYLKRQGKNHKSSVLSASGAETMNDALISVAVLLSAIIYLIWHIDIEAYVSIIIALIIFKVGLEFIFPHLSHHHHHPLEQNPDHDHCGKN